MTKAMKWVVIIGGLVIGLAMVGTWVGRSDDTPEPAAAPAPEEVITTTTTEPPTTTTTPATTTTTTAPTTTTTTTTAAPIDDYCVVNGFDLYEQAVSFESSISLVSRDVTCDAVFAMLESAELAAELDEDIWPVLCTTLVDAGVDGWLSTSPVQDVALARRTVNAVLFAAYFAAPYGSGTEAFLFDCGSGG